MKMAILILIGSLWFSGHAKAFECELPTIHKRHGGPGLREYLASKGRGWMGKYPCGGPPGRENFVGLDAAPRHGRYKPRRTKCTRKQLVKLKKKCRHQQAVMNDPEIQEIIGSLPRMVTVKEVFLEKYPKWKRRMEVPISNHRPDVEDTYKTLAEVYDVADLKAANAICNRLSDLNLIEAKAAWGEDMDEKQITGWWWHYNREANYANCLTSFTTGFLSKKMKRKKQDIRSLEARFGR